MITGYLKKSAFVFCLVFMSIPFMPSSVSAADIVITSPRGGFITSQTIIVSGRINNYNKPKAKLVINGIPQTIFLTGGAFDFKTVVAPGLNLLEFKAANTSKKISFFARVPNRDIKIVFIWDTKTYTDLWVVDPAGEKCYWSNTRTKNGGNLTYNDATYAPQIFTMAKALPGTYSIQAQYYAARDLPVTRVTVYVVLYEGTPRERVSRYFFTMTKGGKVYHITDLQIGNP